MCLLPWLYGDCGCLRVFVHVCDCACLYGDRVVFVCVPGDVYMVIVCVRGSMHVCECVCSYGGCVVFVNISGNVFMVILGLCVGVCMFANVCACMVVVLCSYVSLVMFVW